MEPLTQETDLFELRKRRDLLTHVLPVKWSKLYRRTLISSEDSYRQNTRGGVAATAPTSDVLAPASPRTSHGGSTLIY